MQLASHLLPAGFHYRLYEELDSTSLEAFRLLENGLEPGSWIVAASQQQGKGTQGRAWHSPVGNLYASLYLKPDCSPEHLPQLSILACLAVHTAIETVAGVRLDPGRLCFKWPNDLLLNGGKLSGILLENRTIAAPNEAARHHVVIGIGVNLDSAPDIEGQPFAPTALSNNGFDIAVEALFTELARSMRDWLAIWRNGADFNSLRLAWMQRSCHIGRSIEMRVGSEALTGRFNGIDQSGAMLLIDSTGSKRVIASGQLLSIG